MSWSTARTATMMLGAGLLSTHGGLWAAPTKGEEALAKCVLRRAAPSARALALAVPGSAGEASLFSALEPTLSDCGVSSAANLTADNKTIFVGFVSSRFVGQFGQLSVHWKGTPDLDKFARLMARQTAGYPEHAATAKCVVEVETTESQRFVKSRAGSKGETESLAALQPSISRCVDQGSQFAVSKELFRAEMTRAYFRHICAPNDPPPLGASAAPAGQVR